MSIFRQLERKFRHVSVPGLLRIVAILQLLVYVLILMRPGFEHALLFDPEKVRDGEIWRLVTAPLIPHDLSAIWIIFLVMITIYIGDSLENAWGSFRVTWYFFFGIICSAVAGLLLKHPYLVLTTFQWSWFIYASLFMAFSVCYPQSVIMLFGVLPVPAWMLGALDAAYLAYAIYKAPCMEGRIFILVTQLNFLVFALPLAIHHIKHRQRVAVRRAEFKSKQIPESDAFHQCKVCGRTDATHPELEFRVASDSEEYCAEHLPAADAEAPR
jgi:membrane associated rhomboid family serine protease